MTHSLPVQVDGRFYVNPTLEKLMFEELEQHAGTHGVGGFLPAIKQIANVAALPGIVGVSTAQAILWPMLLSFYI